MIGRIWNEKPEEAKELWCPIPQLQGILYHCHLGPGRWTDSDGWTYTQHGQLVGVDGGHDRTPAREAIRQMNYLRDYFNNEGAVSLAR